MFINRHPYTSLGRRVCCLFAFLLLSFNAHAHGVKLATSEVNLYPNNLLNIKIQFDFIDLLNHHKNHYSLAQIAALNETDFGRLYGEVVKLFEQDLTVINDGKALKLHSRLPSQQQMFDVLKRQFVETSLVSSATNQPYTYSDRRFYQVVFFDTRLPVQHSHQALDIHYPNALGDIYVTYNEPKTTELHQGSVWSRQGAAVKVSYLQQADHHSLLSP